MRNTLPLLAVAVIAATLAAGCASTEKKLGRGVTNVIEPFRLGELRHSMEQAAIFDGPNAGYTTGFFSGINRTLARTGIGVYEIVTAPFPPYKPVWTDYLKPGPVYPANYQPGMLDDTMFATDTDLGFSGGEVAPFVLGSRFRIFDSH
jgi:putative exosortase-associated protein (TIGR04073 family)